MRESAAAGYSACSCDLTGEESLSKGISGRFQILIKNDLSKSLVDATPHP